MTLPENDALQEALRPIASLISKSEKSRTNLRAGTWQHSMLGDNLKALHMASTLMRRGMRSGERWTPDDLRDALQSFASMIGKTEKALARFSLGTPQHTLQRNRLKALRMARDFIQAEADGQSPPEEGCGR